MVRSEVRIVFPSLHLAKEDWSDLEMYHICWKNISVSIHKWENHNVNDGEVDWKYNDDRFRADKEKWPIQIHPQAFPEGCLDYFRLWSVSRVTCCLPKMMSFPLQKEWPVSFRLKQQDQTQYQNSKYRHNPWAPSPAYCAHSNIRSYDGAYHWTSVGHHLQKWKGQGGFQWTPQIRDGSPSTRQRNGPKQSCEKSKHNCGAVIWGEARSHDEDYEDEHRDYVYNVSAKGLWEGTRHKSTGAESNQIAAW